MFPNISEKGEYLYGQNAGKWIKWHENGNILEEGNYFEGNKTGTWHYYDCDGDHDTEEFLNGILITNIIQKWAYVIFQKLC